MVTPELKGWDCVDHDPIEDWVPESDTVLYWLVLHIGPSGDQAADLYTVPVANYKGLPEWKERHRRAEGKTIVPIVVDPYSWSAVLHEIHRRLAQVWGVSWLGVSEQLRLHFHWEYEGM